MTKSSCTGARRLFLFISVLVLIATPVPADPPPDPPPCQGFQLDPLFCIRTTAIARDLVDDDKFQYMLEFVNWTADDAHGLVISLNTGPNPGGDAGGAPFFSAAAVDADGRPLGPGALPPSGNDPVSFANDWFVVSQTASRIEFAKTVDPIDHPMALGFDGLLDPDFAMASQTDCENALLMMIPDSSALDLGGGMTLIQINDPESIDDDTNTRDGFVIEIDDFDAGEELSINWHFLGASGESIGIVDTTGAVMGDQYGFGIFNLTRLNSAAPPPLFNGANTGYDPPDDSDPDQDSPLFWAEDEVAGVDGFLVNPIPVGTPGQGIYHAVEPGVAVTAEFEETSDNAFMFGGQAVTSGTNVQVLAEGAPMLGPWGLGILGLCILIATVAIVVRYRVAA